jgi:hypothetical protein
MCWCLRRFSLLLLVVLMQMMTIQCWKQVLPWKRLVRSQTFFQTKYSFSVYDTSKLSAILEMNPDLKQKPSRPRESQKLGRLFHFQDTNLQGSNFAGVPVSVPLPPTSPLPPTPQHEQPRRNPHSPSDDRRSPSTSPTANPASVPLSSQVSSSTSSPAQFSPSNSPKPRHPEFKYSQKYHTLKNLYQEVRSYLSRVQGDQRAHYDQYLRTKHLFRSDSHLRLSSSPSSSASVTPPADYFHFTSITFYHFHSMTIQQYQNIQTHFIPKITEINPWIKGTLIMAINEGINGQVFVPKSEMKSFMNLLFKLDPIIFPREIFNIGKEIEVPVIRSESFQMELHAYELLKKNEYLFRHNSWTGDSAFEPPPLLEEAINDKKMKKKTKKEEGKKQPAINPKLIHDETMKNQDYDGREISEFEKRKICLMVADLQALQRVLYFHVKQAMNYLPMTKLVIKQKNQLLTDGLLVIHQSDDESDVKRKDEEKKVEQETEKKSSRKLSLEEQLKLKPPCNWEDAGPELSPEEWHQEIQDNLKLLNPLLSMKMNENNRKKEEIPLVLGEKMRTPDDFLFCFHFEFLKFSFSK